jgi:hypothetical protein
VDDVCLKAAGECNKNPGYMQQSCRASCGVGGNAEPLQCDGRPATGGAAAQDAHLEAYEWDRDEEL